MHELEFSSLFAGMHLSRRLVVAARLLFCAVAAPLKGPGTVDVTILVRSQDTPLDRSRLQALRTEIENVGWPREVVVSMADAERELAHRGLWTYKPWLFLHERNMVPQGRNCSEVQCWILFFEPATSLNASALILLLDQYDARRAVYIGRSLLDRESSRIHHYQTEPPYPQAHAGFALSGGLVAQVVKHLEDNALGNNQQIEPVWELASMIKSLGVDLTDRSDALCIVPASGCSTWVQRGGRINFNGPFAPRDVVIGVKTVEKNHETRIPLVHRVWGSSSVVEVLYLTNTMFTGEPGARTVDLSVEFGDAVDPKKEATRIGTGHCSKMHSILTYFYHHCPGRRWYVVTDDDTLLNVPQLLEVLGSHDDREGIYIGERYSWSHQAALEGTNYVTTGGGMALSGPALSALMDCEHCHCRTPDTPDDMMLGIWFRDMQQVQLVHEESFHQNEPHNYHPEILQIADPPVSFHRFGKKAWSPHPTLDMDAFMENWLKWKTNYFEQEKQKVRTNVESRLNALLNVLAVSDAGKLTIAPSVRNLAATVVEDGHALLQTEPAVENMYDRFRQFDASMNEVVQKIAR